MKTLGFSLALLFLLLGCKTKQTPIIIEVEDARADWMKNRPISSAFYIGISGTSKTSFPLDYAANGKIKALEDLASEIKIRIESSSVLFQLDKNGTYRDNYESIIKSKTSQEIEGFELIDAWENDKEYWVYYRLSKAKFKEIQREKQQTAQRLALSSYKKGLAFEKQRQLLPALHSYLSALHTLENYLGELNGVEYQGKTIYLGSEIYNSIQKLMNDITITSSPQITYVRGITGDKMIKAAVQYKNRGLENYPLSIEFSSGEGKLSSTAQTNKYGEVNFVLSSVQSAVRNQELIVSLDFEKTKTQNAFYKTTLDNIVLPQKAIYLAVGKPSVYVSSVEKLFGLLSTTNLLKDYTTKQLINQGFTIASSKQSADLIYFISSDTKKGLETSGIFSSYLTASFVMKKKVTNKTLYTGKLIDIKGVQLDYLKAGEDAYKRALKSINKKILAEMGKVIFK